ncbi:MAG: IMP cyclohydrolase [Candidatus Woesearchaeota archaeon]|nr:IMP cyclohydrolase [Candidatus Woesearchaeota archaeon]
MIEGLEALANMEYPGRFIIIGQDLGKENNILVYGITGRSPPSQARKLVEDKDAEVGSGVIRTDVTDKKQLEKGNPALLIYPAIALINNALIVSNGAQTALIYRAAKANPLKTNAAKILNEAFEIASPQYDSKNGWIDITKHEPDDPNFTPRISGCLQPDSAAFYIMRRDQMGSRHDDCYDIALEGGKGKLIATYSGKNIDPLPSFAGGPLDVGLEGKTIDETAKEVYDALAPLEIRGMEDPAKDFRVGVAVVYSNRKTSENKISIINRCDLGGK